jgi:hypothetical protein
MIVNGLTLPTEVLVSQAERKNYCFPTGYPIGNSEEAQVATLYELHSIAVETENLLNIFKVQVLKADLPKYNFYRDEMDYFFADDKTRSVEMTRAIVIGDFGVDNPICLEFLSSGNNVVKALSFRDQEWITISSTYEAFLSSVIEKGQLA